MIGTPAVVAAGGVPDGVGVHGPIAAPADRPRTPSPSPSPLPAPPIRFGDDALRQRGWLAGGEPERRLADRERRLADLEPLRLPTDDPRPAATRRAARHRLVLPGDLRLRLAGWA